MADEKDRISKIFTRYLGRDATDQVATSGIPLLDAGVEPATVHFVLAQVSEADAERIPELIGKAVDLMMDAGSSVDSIVSSLIVATYGFPVQDPGAPAKTRALAHHIVDQMGTNVRLVWGSLPGYVGNIGTELRMTYGSILPRFTQVLTGLLDTPFGKGRQVAAGPGATRS